MVCGYVTTAQGDRWLVRKRTTTTTYVKQGKTQVPVTTISWVTSDDFQLSTGQPAQAWGITHDASGNIFATGRVADGLGDYHWFTRKLLAQ